MMIKEKLIFSKDYGVLNKKCYCCESYYHSINECPRLHYSPNIEKIIKKLNYPKMQERSTSTRRKMKLKALHLVKSNEKIVKKLFKNMQNKSMHSSVYSEESIYDDNEMDSEKELLKKTSSIQKTHTLSYENLKIPSEANLKSFNEEHKNDNSLSQEVMDVSLEKKKDHKEFNRLVTMEVPKEEKRAMFKESKYTTVESQDNKILKDPNENYREKKEIKEQHSFSPLKINSIISTPWNSHEFGFDKVHNYKNYFPLFNVTEISKTQTKLKNMEKDILRKYLRRNYKKFKDYSFYVNETLEKFWKEKKKIKKNKSKEPNKNENSNGSFSNSKKENINEEGLQPKDSPSGLRVNISPKKSFFKQEKDEEEGKIKSFSELIKTLIKKKNPNLSPNDNN